MNFVWEAALCADRSGIDREDIRYRPTQAGSPYLEVMLENLNDSLLTQPVVEVNPLYRFSAVFSEIFDINLSECRELREIFFDIYMQYMVQLDLRQRLSRKEYQLKYILKDFLSNVCQIDSRTAVLQMARGEVPQLMQMVWKLYRCRNGVQLFRNAMRILYPSSLIYENREKTNQLLVYIGERENDEGRIRMEYLQAVFLPIHVEVYLFWDHHFGIIGIDETMIINEMVLF